MAQPLVRVRRATPGDVDNVAPLIARQAEAGQGPSAERVQYVFSSIVTEPNIEIYVAEVERTVVGFLTVYYLEYLGRGGLSASVTEAVAEVGPLEAQALAELLERAQRAALARRCRRIDLAVPLDQQTLRAVASDLGFEATAQGLSLVAGSRQ